MHSAAPASAAVRDLARVEEAGREFVSKHGAESLSKVAKMHFRTRYRVLGEPEPPKVEWKRPAKKPDAGGDE